MERDERKPTLSIERIGKLAKILNRIYEHCGNPFCASWLGHALYLKEIKKCFKNYMIIWCKRDLLSTAVSLVKLMRNDASSKTTNYVSIRPIECDIYNDYKVMSDLEMAARQVYFMNKKIEQSYAQGTYNIIESNYADLCKDPGKSMLNIQSAAESFGIELKLKQENFIPEKFSLSTLTRPADSYQVEALTNIFLKLVDEYGAVKTPVSS